MAKKQLTPEQYKAKLEKKAEKRKKFANLFLKTVAICVAIVIVYSATSVAFTRIGLATVVKNTTITFNQQGQNNNNDDYWNDGDDNNDPPAIPPEDPENPDDGKADVMTSKTMQFDLFVKAFNGVKTNAKSVTQPKKNAYNYDADGNGEGDVDAGGNGLIEGIGKALMGSLLKEEETNVTYTGADIAANFPPSGATCGLTKDDIKSIECKEEGNYYVVTVVVKPAKNPKAGEKVGAVATILTKESIEEPLKQYGLTGLSFDCDYHATTAIAKIEKSTGNLVEYYFDLPMLLYVDSKYSVGLGFEEWWTIAY